LLIPRIKNFRLRIVDFLDLYRFCTWGSSRLPVHVVPALLAVASLSIICNLHMSEKFATILPLSHPCFCAYMHAVPRYGYVEMVPET